MVITFKEVPATTFVVSSHDEVTIPEISALARGVVDDMLAALLARGIPPTAPVHFVYQGADGTLDTRFRLTFAIPVSERPAEPVDGYEVVELPEFRCVASDFVGAMPDIQWAYDQLIAAIHARGWRMSGQSREIYKKWVAFESPDNVTELQVGFE